MNSMCSASGLLEHNQLIIQAAIHPLDGCELWVTEGIMETTIWLRKMGWLYIQDKKLRKEILYAKLPVQK